MVNRSTARNPYYRQVYDRLKDQITSGEIPKDSYLPPEREIGLTFDVDRLTVRKALDILVDDGLVEKRAGIGTYVKGTSMDTVSQNIGNARNILIIFPSYDDPNIRIDYIFRASILFNAEKECRKQGYNFICVQDVPGCNLASLANGNSFKGIIFVSSVGTNLLQESVMSGIPSVMIDQVFDGITSIVSDDESGIQQAVKCLVNRGHKRIGVITGLFGDYNADRRLGAFRKAMTEAGLEVPDEYIAEGNWTYKEGETAMRQLLSLPEPPTAVLAGNDASAIGALCAAKELDVSVPDDVSIIGFDNIEESAFTMPKLTTVSVNIEYSVHIACMHLFYHIESGMKDSCRVMVPVRLVERDSVSECKDTH